MASIGTSLTGLYQSYNELVDSRLGASESRRRNLDPIDASCSARELLSSHRGGRYNSGRSLQTSRHSVAGGPLAWLPNSAVPLSPTNFSPSLLCNIASSGSKLSTEFLRFITVDLNERGKQCKFNTTMNLFLVRKVPFKTGVLQFNVTFKYFFKNSV